MTKVLIVDDDKELRQNLLEIMEGAGYQVDTAANGSEAVEKAIDEDFDVILLDLIMPKMKGSDVLIELRRVSPQSRVIMLTAFATIGNAVEAIKRGATDYMAKPFKINDLLMRVRYALEEARIDIDTRVQGDFDDILNSLSNPIRRKILRVLSLNVSARLRDIVKDLGVEDHTKVIFHLKMLKDALMLEQGIDKTYSLTEGGHRALESLKIFESYLKKTTPGSAAPS